MCDCLLKKVEHAVGFTEVSITNLDTVYSNGSQQRSKKLHFILIDVFNQWKEMLNVFLVSDPPR